MLSRLSRARLCATPWTVARQAPLSMGFSRQECWSGLLPILFKKKKKNPEGSFSENQNNDLLFKNSCKTKPLFQGARKFASISVSLQKSITHRPVSASRCASGKSLSVCKREHDCVSGRLWRRVIMVTRVGR